MLTVESLRKPESERIAIPQTASHADAVAMFEAHPDLKILPVLDAEARPVGAILEQDVRQILYNPYGHALLRNPRFGGALAQRIKPCAVADRAAPLGELLALHAEAGGQDGLILTAGGRYCGVIEAGRLVAAASAHERDRLAQRERQLDGLRTAGESFEGDIGALVDGLRLFAADLERSAAETSLRGEETGRRASAVAVAAGQTGGAMASVAAHGAAQVSALDRLQAETAEARTTAARAVDLVAAGVQRAIVLQDSTRSIERITALIDGLAGKVNMLAINATIEAARAGEAGRGFAIVAAEIRALAGQTRAAAEEIRGHSSEVSLAADDVVAGQNGIEDVIASVDRIARSVDRTVQAQRTMTIEIADGADQASAASHAIQHNIEGIHGSALAAAGGAAAMQRMAGALAGASDALGRRVARFLATVRAAV